MVPVTRDVQGWLEQQLSVEIKYFCSLAVALLLLGVSASVRLGTVRQLPCKHPWIFPPMARFFNWSRELTGVDIVNQLGRLGLTRPGWEWRLLMRLEPHVYRAGEYRLEAGIKPQEVLGKTVQRAGHPIPDHAGGGLDISAIRRCPCRQHGAETRTMIWNPPAQWPRVASDLGIASSRGLVSAGDLSFHPG